MRNETQNEIIEMETVVADRCACARRLCASGHPRAAYAARSPSLYVHHDASSDISAYPDARSYLYAPC
jgi:hypothetical protein